MTQDEVILQNSKDNISKLDSSIKKLDKCIKICKQENIREVDLIYDPFMGSGTTAADAVNLNRNWIGSEISEKYCDIIRNRLSEIVKEDPLW